MGHNKEIKIECNCGYNRIMIKLSKCIPIRHLEVTNTVVTAFFSLHKVNYKL